MNAILGLLVSAFTGTLKDWLTSRSEIDKAKAEARVHSIKNGIPGWSDEFIVLCLSFPLIGAFIPQLQPYVAAGFQQIEALPDWYVALYVTVVCAVFGIDKLFKFRGGK